MKADEFKVGDTVYCLIYGKGIVKHIYIDGYPVCVEFFNGNSTFTVGYTQGGKYDKSGPRTLFFEEILIPESAYKRPIWRAEEGDKYYYINSKGQLTISDDFRRTDQDMNFKHGNYFKTEAEAKESKFYKVFHEEE